jgi:Uma2 family endonuclease
MRLPGAGRAKAPRFYASCVSEAPALMTLDEYLAFEEHSPVRHELVAGHVYAMAGGTERHDLTVGLLYEALAPGARRAGCRAFVGNRKLVTARATYYPDLFVTCGPAPHTLYEVDATVVVEVLSPSTATVDKREKLLAYGSLSSLRQYLLVDPLYRSISEAVSDPEAVGGFAWTDHGPGGVVVTSYGPIVIDDLYDAVDASATT